MQRILNWAKSDSAERILWVSGSAGTGKSAIAQTIAERFKQNVAEGSEQKVHLAATFFFFRTSPERNTSERLITTLAYQVALCVPGAKEFIAKAIEDDPAVFTKDMNSQLFQLIVHPVILAAQGWSSTQQSLIIIDGLDECIDEKEQTDILSAICDALTTRELPLRFLILSRPEYDIRMRFEHTDLQSATVRFVLDMDDMATKDIATFLEAEFTRIHREHCIRETPWPPKDVIQSLAERASGQFIYASTIIKFLDDRHFQPQERLEMVLGILPHGTFSPFAEIDFLYTRILDAVPACKVERTLLCLGAIIDQHHLKIGYVALTEPKFLDQLFQLNPGGVEHFLKELHSVLNIKSEVSIRHKSFSDFLTNEARSGRYFIDKDTMWSKILGLLWTTIPQRLKHFEDDKSSPHLRADLHDETRTWS